MSVNPETENPTMLREVFLIDEGLLLFHYSADSSANDDDKAVLSSGLLSALQSFSSQARSGTIESFATEDEYFLFTKCPKTGRVLVGVFNRLAPEGLAKQSLERIQDIMKETEIRDSGEQLTLVERQRVRALIRQVELQLFDKGFFELHVEKILKNRNDISLAFLVDTTDNSLVTQFARPKPLFQKSQVEDFLLLYSTINKTLANLGIASEYSHFVIVSKGYSAASYNATRFVSMASGAMRVDADKVLDTSVRLCFPTEDVPHLSRLANGEIEGVSVLLEDGSFEHIEGKELPAMSHVYLSTLENNVDTFSKSVSRRIFSEFHVSVETDQPKGISLIRSSDGESLRIEMRNA